MPVWKYRSIDEMPATDVMNRDVPLGRRLRALESLGNLAGPLRIPRGVTKFRSIDDMQADRERYEQARIERIRNKNASR